MPERRGMNERRKVLVVVAAALLVRLVLLWVRGDYIVYDEGYYLLLARSLRAGRGFTLSGLPHVSLSPLQPIVVAALSLTGLPDLWASRMLAAVCGALLVVPVSYLAREWFGPRAAMPAAVFVAVAPGLITFLPFFPGESWNLYFGSEPLYLLLAMGALAALWRGLREESGRWLACAGALVALAYLTRLEGAVLGAAIAAAAMAWLAVTRRLAVGMKQAVPGVALAALIVSPYVVYLHGALGRWALSGRVQSAAAAQAADASPPPVAQGAGGGPSSAVNAFVWGGDREALWRALYALDASGTRMASQYWGVQRNAEERVGQPTAPSGTGALGGAPAPAPAAVDSAARREHRSAAPEGASPAPTRVVLHALTIIAPWWFLLLALPGIAWANPRWQVVACLAAAVASAALPAALAYVEPRALLILVPVACILAGGTAAQLGDLLARRAGREATWAIVPAVIAVGLAAPTARDLTRSWNQDMPLQQVATARRAVGEYLGAHLEKDARIVSWHPAIALYAKRDWRVLPYDSFGRIARYAQAQSAAIVVLSRFEPSPLRNPPRAFTAVLIDPGSAPPGEEIHLDPVDQTPLLFVGRLARAP